MAKSAQAVKPTKSAKPTPGAKSGAAKAVKGDAPTKSGASASGAVKGASGNASRATNGMPGKAAKPVGGKGSAQAGAKAPSAKPLKAAATADSKSAKPLSKGGPSKTPSKAPAKTVAKTVAKTPTKTPAQTPTKPSAKSPSPNGAGAAVASARSGKSPVAAPSKSSKSAAGKTSAKASDKSAPQKDAKGGKSAKEPKAAKAKAPKEPGRKSSSKRGPIDLSTAKSVAAVAAASQADSSGYVVINGRRVRMISTKGLPAPRRSKALVEKEVEKPEIQVSTIKTKLTKKELDEYRSLLLAKRRQIIGTISGLEDEALRSNGGNLSNMPLHMADIGTDTFDQDFTLGMAQTERQTLSEIDAALQRIESKSYGVCQLTGKPIPKARLEAKPWAKFSIEAAKLVERGVVPR